MIEPRVSVLMPVWNAERFLDEAVESVLGQTFGDFELIVIDDGSSDGSKRTLKEWASRDPRVVVLSRPNTGIAGALNDGLECARGEYIARMDADDVSYPERFEHQVEFLDQHPECALVGCDHLEVDTERWPIAPRRVPCGHEEIEATLFGGIAGAITHAACMIRRASLQGLGDAYRAKYPVGEDLDLFLRLGERGRLANLREILYEVRRHAASVTRTGSERWAYELKRAILEEACSRRGLSLSGIRMMHGERDLAAWQHHLGFALRARSAGNWKTVRKHAILALRGNPASLRTWRVFAQALLRSALRRGPAPPPAARSRATSS